MADQVFNGIVVKDEPRPQDKPSDCPQCGKRFTNRIAWELHLPDGKTCLTDEEMAAHPRLKHGTDFQAWMLK